MAIQNNNKDEKPTLTDEELNKPLTPEDEKSIDAQNNPQPPADALPEEETIIPDSKEQEPEDDTIEGLDEEHKEELEARKPKDPVKEPEKSTDDERDKRYKEQQREAEILTEQRKSIVDAFDKAEKLADPTEDEVQSYVKDMGGDWDVLSDFEKGLAKDNLVAKRKQDALNQGLRAIRDADNWANTVDTFLEKHDTDQTYKQLIGREQEFRSFAMKASHRGVAMEYLVPSFLFQIKEVAKKKGSLMLNGGGGEKPNNAPSDVITDAQQAARLRTSDPQEYRRKLKAGKIKLSVE